MPVILLWNDAAQNASAQFMRWLDSFKRSNFLLERWLEKRVREAEELDRLTRDFPVFRFYNLAVTARVAGFQFGALLSAPVAGVGEHIERALGQWNVGRRVSIARRETSLLPNLFRILEEIATGVLASIDRFRTPSAAMFDPTQRRFADIPGIAVMVYGALASSQGYLLRTATRVRDAIMPRKQETERSAAGDESGGAAAQTTTGLFDSLAEQADSLLRFLVGGLLVIPAIARLLGVVGGDLLVSLRFVLLDALQKIEARAYAFRRSLLTDLVNNLRVYGRQAVVLLAAAREVAISYLQFYAQVGIAYLRGMIGGVRTFAEQMRDFWSGLTGVIGQVVRYGNAILAIDVGPILHNAFETVKDAIEQIDFHMYAIGDSPDEYDPPDEFAVTVEEMVLNTGAGVRGLNELRKANRYLINAWNGADPIARAMDSAVVYRTVGYNIPGYVAAVNDMTGALSLPRAGAPTQPKLTFSAGSVPDWNTEIIQPLRKGLSQAVGKAITGVATGVDGMVATVVNTLDSTAAAFDTAAARASRMGSLRLLQRLTGDTDALMQSLFGKQEIERTPSGLGPVAGVYAQWLIQGGFDMVGAAMAGYIGMVLDEWTAHIAEGDDLPVEITASSPRKVLARARLGRVHTPTITITARRQELGKPLAERIAGGFQEAVQQAYATGQTRLGQMAAEAGAP